MLWAVRQPRATGEARFGCVHRRSGGVFIARSVWCVVCNLQLVDSAWAAVVYLFHNDTTAVPYRTTALLLIVAK